MLLSPHFSAEIEVSILNVNVLCSCFVSHPKDPEGSAPDHREFLGSKSSWLKFTLIVKLSEMQNISMSAENLGQ